MKNTLTIRGEHSRIANARAAYRIAHWGCRSSTCSLKDAAENMMLACYLKSSKLTQNVHTFFKKSLSSIPADQIGKSYSERQARRLAEQMKDENVESEYMDRIRGQVQTADSLIAGLEHELMGEIAAALKSSEDKVNWALLQCDLIEQQDEPTKENIEKHKYWRKEVDDRRRNLIIHRQACGFRINNYSFVQKLFPIPPKWPSADGKKAPLKKAGAGDRQEKQPLSWNEKMRMLYERRR